MSININMREYKPYIYKLTLTKGDETKYYIGSRSSKTKIVNPSEFLDGRYNTSSDTVKEMLKDGWQDKREILETFDGNRQGAMQCGVKEGKLLKEVNAKSNDQYVNDNENGCPAYHHSIENSNKRKGRKLTEEHKRKIRIARKGKNKGPKTEEHKHKISETLTGAYTGSNSSRYKSFKVIAVMPDGVIKEYVFDDDRPARTCLKTLGIQYLDQSKMKKGNQWVIKSIKPSSRHPFDKGTKLTIELLKS